MIPVFWATMAAMVAISTGVLQRMLLEMAEVLPTAPLISAPKASAGLLP